MKRSGPDASSGVFERRKCLLRKTDFTSRFNLICPFNPSSENIWLAPSGKSVAFLRAFRTHKRGASRSSRVSGAGCDGRGRCQLTSDVARGWRNRVVPIPRRWDQALDDGDVGPAGVTRRDLKVTEAIKPGTPGRARISRTPSCRECRNVSAYLW